MGVIVVRYAESDSSGGEGGHGSDRVEEKPDEFNESGIRGEGAGVTVVRVRSSGGVGSLQACRVAFVRLTGILAIILLRRARESAEPGHHRVAERELSEWKAKAERGMEAGVVEMKTPKKSRS